MAARENQGLQIALIIFVMLTILLSVSTYMLFTRFQEQQEKAKAAEKLTSDEKTKEEKLTKERSDLLTVIGNGDDVPTALTQANKDFTENFVATGMAGLPDDGRNYKKALASVLDAIKSKDTTADDRQKQIVTLNKQLVDAAATAETKMKDIKAALDQAVADLEKERGAYKQSVEDLKKEKDTLVAEKTDKNKAIDELKATYERRIADLNGQLAKSMKEVQTIRGLINTYEVLNASESGGKITWVNQRENMAYVNMGYEDGLRRRITFSVYAPGTTDISKATPKGKIEIVNVTGPHQAEATILDNPINNTILAGDLIHTQGWRPGQHEHFAVCGLIDIDGSSTDQTKKLHDLILANGGIVDAEIELRKDANGALKPAVKGNLTVNTRYLIVGELNTDKPAAADRITPSTTLMNEAKRLGVEQVGLQKFLAMMGYTPRSGAGGANGGTVSSGPDRGDEFRPRTPPARGTNGAF